MLTLFSANPIFGVDFTVESEAAPLEQVTKPRVEEDVEIVDDQDDAQAIAAYVADDGELENGEFTSSSNIQFDSTLGLAIESLKDDITLEQLWRVV